MINAEIAEKREGKSLNDLSYLVIRRAMNRTFNQFSCYTFA